MIDYIFDERKCTTYEADHNPFIVARISKPFYAAPYMGNDLCAKAGNYRYHVSRTKTGKYKGEYYGNGNSGKINMLSKPETILLALIELVDEIDPAADMMTLVDNYGVRSY